VEALTGPLIIRPVLLIRILGGVLGGLISIPYCIAILYFLINPSKAVENPAGVFMSLGFAVPGTWLTYRWVTIRGQADFERIVLRGWLKTLSLSAWDFSHLREVRVEGVGDKPSKTMLRVVGRCGSELGTIPATVGFCRGFGTFVASLSGIAEQSRNVHRDQPLPQSERTTDDLG